MIKIIYLIQPEQKEKEVDWLAEQKIFPALHDTWNWKTNKAELAVGVIVSEDAALAIKLRHKLQLQIDWRQR